MFRECRKRLRQRWNTAIRNLVRTVTSKQELSSFLELLSSRKRSPGRCLIPRALVLSRGTERLKERPLLKVDPNQGYIHYRKGSLALYYLAEMIGEARINAALKDLIEKFAYKGPPYPTSYELVDRLRDQTPEELKYLIKDLFVAAICLFRYGSANQEIDHGLIPKPAFIEIMFSILDYHQLSKILHASLLIYFLDGFGVGFDGNHGVAVTVKHKGRNLCSS